MSQPETPTAAAGAPGVRAPSGATSPGTTPADEAPTSSGAEQPATQVAGQAPGTAAPPVPSPGDAPGTSLPAVSAAQGPSPSTGIHEGEKEAGADASVASPGSFVALNPPGQPDGQVDTRAT